MCFIPWCAPGSVASGLMRIEVGRHCVTATNGRTIHVDQPISVRQADFILTVLDRAFLHEDLTFAVEMTEGELVIEHCGRDDQGKRTVNVVDGVIIHERTVLRF